ncbi:MAG: Hpt domain-containing protein, partial [Plesiomonas sp.]
MSFELDEEILHDFLIEAGEIIERLSEQLVELEQQPNDKELLNAIFRGFHTVKGGAGFLSLTALVDTCHGAENVFDVLRNGKRSIDSNLMDVILLALDTVVAQFQQIQQGDEPEPAAPSLLHELHQLCDPDNVMEHADICVDTSQPPMTIASADNVHLASAASLSPANSSIPNRQNENAACLLADRQFGLDDISDDEFESLLDALHGVGQSPTVNVSRNPLLSATNAELITSVSKNAVVTPVAPALQPEMASTDSANGSENEGISDDEFERLLDDLHGVGQAPNSLPHSVGMGGTTAVTENATSADAISDDEFERLLDDLHGVGKGPALSAIVAPPVEPAHISEVHSAPSVVASTAMATQPSAGSAAFPQAAKTAATAETTLRVDTKTLDEIMNMVGELVLVRNRLVSLGLNSEDEEMAKACANLDVVTADLQGAVMKTRMQPIRKVFGRFPRVVRDLARSLKKEVQLELSGEDTDLDKNLVEALADPL